MNDYKYDVGQIWLKITEYSYQKDLKFTSRIEAVIILYLAKTSFS